MTVSPKADQTAQLIARAQQWSLRQFDSGHYANFTVITVTVATMHTNNTRQGANANRNGRTAATRRRSPGRCKVWGLSSSKMALFTSDYVA